MPDSEKELLAEVCVTESAGTWSAKVEKPKNTARQPTRPSPKRTITYPGFANLPAVQTMIMAGIVALAFVLLGIHEKAGVGTALFSKPEWDMWKLVAALSISLSMLLLVRGVSYCRQLHPLQVADPRKAVAELWGWAQKLIRWVWQLLPGWAKRPAEWLWRWFLVVFAVLFVAAVVLLVSVGISSRDRAWPDNWVHLKITIVLLFNAIAAVPWVVLVWCTHARLRKEAASPDAADKLGRLLQLWPVITACVLAFGSFVVLALVPTAVLRAAWFSQFGSPTDAAAVAFTFPSTDVLLYGAFFGAVSLAVAFPLISSWRREAVALVDRTYGYVKIADFDKDEDEVRTALEGRLGLNTGILRSPLAAFTIFVPLVTTALAVFIPELGK